MNPETLDPTLSTLNFQPYTAHPVRTQSWTGPPRAGEGGEAVIYVDIRHEPILGKTSLKRIPLTCGIKYGYPNILHLKLSTLNTKPSTLNPKP